MKKWIPLALCCVMVVPQESSACDCFGNDSYCATLDPSWYVNPVSTVLAVKLTNYYYGITVKVVQVIGGEALPSDTLMVWGDNGALCRIGVNGFAIGDTIVFGLNHCDLWGNDIWNSQFPPDLEHTEDYMVSVCGVYWLNYNNGLVSGAITAPTVQSMTLQEFAGMVQNCSAPNAVTEITTPDPLVVRYEDGVPVLESPSIKGTAELLVCDTEGRAVLRRAWNGRSLALSDLSDGLYVVRVSGASGSDRRSVLVDRQ